MKPGQTIEKSNSPKHFESAPDDHTPTLLSKLVFFLLCAVPVSATIIYGAVDTWALAFLSILVGLIAIFWLADSFFRREFQFSSNRLQLPLLGLILIGLFQLLPLRSANVANELLSVSPVRSISLDPYATRYFVIKLCLYFVFFAASLVFLENQKRLRKIVYTIIIFGSAMSFFGIIQYLSGSDKIYGLRFSSESIPFASFVNKNLFAAFMEMTIGLNLGLLYSNSAKRDNLLLLIISIVLMGMGLVFTGSRGGMLSLFGVFGFVTLYILLRKENRENSIKGEQEYSVFQSRFVTIGSVLALFLCLVGSVLFLNGENFVLRGLGLQNPTVVDNGRLHFWQVALQIIRDHPIIGVGFDGFGLAFTKYDTWNGAFRIEQAHNDYLQIFADAGILGFICALIFIFLLFKQGLRVVSQSSDRFRSGVAIGSLAGCFGILIHSFFEFPLRIPSNAFFFLTLIALANVSIHYPEAGRKAKSLINHNSDKALVKNEP